MRTIASFNLGQTVLSFFFITFFLFTLLIIQNYLHSTAGNHQKAL